MLSYTMTIVDSSVGKDYYCYCYDNKKRQFCMKNRYFPHIISIEDSPCYVME